MTVLASKFFESGPNGATVSLGTNEKLVATGTASLTYSSLAPIQGSFSGRVQAAAGEFCYLVQTVPTPAATLYYQVLFTTPPVAPSVPLFLVGVFSGNSPAVDVRINTDMSITIRDRGTSNLARWTSPPLPLNTRVRASGRCTPSGGSTALRGKLYVGEVDLAGTTPTYDSGDLLSQSALTTVDQIHTGVLYATTAAWAVEFDAVTIQDAEPGPVTVNPLKPPTTNTPPVVDAGSDQTIYPGTATVTLTAVASDAGGSIASYSWRTITAGAPAPVGTGATRTLTSPVLRFDQTYTYGVTVTDNGGLSSPESTVDITFLATTAWHCTSTGALVPMTVIHADGSAPPAGVPAAPTGVALDVAAATSQPLHWFAPSNGGAAITDYVVQYKLSTAATWTTFADGTSTATTATVTGLTPSTSYDYRVAAVNSVGTGPFAPFITGSTNSTTPATFDTDATFDPAVFQ